jgi:hypothetical protein
VRFPAFVGASWPALSSWAARVAIEFERLLGELPVTGEVTLGTSVGTTTVNHPGLTAARKIVLMPTTANAATEFGAGTLHISGKSRGSFEITHINSATAGHTFDWIAV